MLIISAPKSASTSLMKTLGVIHDMSAEQLFFHNSPTPKSLVILHKYHSDIREITPQLATNFASRKFLYKQHLPPTENNLKVTRQIKKVILTREPDEIIAAYYRAQQKKLHKPKPEFDSCNNLEDWQETAISIGLKKDLEYFINKWSMEVKEYPNNNLCITYCDLVNQPQKTINLIEKYYNLPLSQYVNLSKMRYSRRSKFLDYLCNWIN